LQLVLARLIDMDGNGAVTPEKIAAFFLNIWADPESRLKINRISKTVVNDETNEKCYLLIQQMCKELSLDYYFELIKSKGVNTKMFLSATFPELQAAFKEIDPEHIALLYLKA
jgi:hypothetical protein